MGGAGPRYGLTTLQYEPLPPPHTHLLAGHSGRSSEQRFGEDGGAAPPMTPILRRPHRAAARLRSALLMGRGVPRSGSRLHFQVMAPRERPAVICSANPRRSA
ncbi:hypothetical protein NDU88_004437 [Pleurodeles waltl]|uniref:Uncharacterized protein n=1 Tax=Pleurodeles waltl TaxID=8319 RepID=A0AAV7SIS4_PLEWA|nr:hypothetical protein NDU88_004437 [Pleurodeles waltl]